MFSLYFYITVAILAQDTLVKVCYLAVSLVLLMSNLQRTQAVERDVERLRDSLILLVARLGETIKEHDKSIASMRGDITHLDGCILQVRKEAIETDNKLINMSDVLARSVGIPSSGIRTGSGSMTGSMSRTGIRAGSMSRTGIRAGSMSRAGIRAGSMSRTGIRAGTLARAGSATMLQGSMLMH